MKKKFYRIFKTNDESESDVVALITTDIETDNYLISFSRYINNTFPTLSLGFDKSIDEVIEILHGMDENKVQIFYDAMKKDFGS